MEPTPHQVPVPASEYILGTKDDELERLGFQHRLWSAQAAGIWERAGFQPGHSILDVGCGPGFASLDLCSWVGRTGRVVAVDESPKFIAFLRGRAKALGISFLEPVEADVQLRRYEPESFDGAYARWVLCFVADPKSVVARVAEALKPGGTFAVQDYLNYRALTLSPPSPAMTRVVAAVDASWRARGGDPEIGQRLPAIMAECGLKVRTVDPVVRLGGPRDPIWHWPGTFFRNYLPVLAEMGLLTKDERREFETEWAQRTRDPLARFCSPIVVDIVAAKV